MGGKNVDFTRLAAALDEYHVAYLLTVGDDYRVHTVTVEPVLRDHVLDVGLINGRTRQNLTDRTAATLLWPPLQPGGYALIVDGHAELAEGEDEAVQLTVLPTRALLHRKADSPTTASSPLHDCVVFTTS